MQEPRKNIDAFSYIRVIACLAIVLLHSVFASTVYFKGEADPIVMHAVSDLLMWAVPCFLMVTGALQLTPARSISMKKLYGKYVKRVLIALVSFTLIFRILEDIAGERDFTFTGWLSDLLQGQSWAHMWYLYLLIGLYVMLPFYRMVVEKASDRQLWLLIAILILFVSIVPMCEAFGYECGFYIPTQVIYPAYLFLGYMMCKRPLPLQICAALFLAASAAITCTAVFAPESLHDALDGYASPLVIVQSAGAFGAMHCIRRPAGRLLKSLDDCSFGIYLIHMIGIRLIMKWMGFDPYIGIIPLNFAAMAILLFAASYIVAFAIRKIPKLNLL